MAKGYIYVITNEGKPGLCKVGFTERNPEARAKELDGTHDPFPHEVTYAVKLDDAKKIEKKIHDELKEYRVGSSAEKTGREWFRCSVSQCRKVIQKYDIPDKEEKSEVISNKIEYVPAQKNYLYIVGSGDRCRVASIDKPLHKCYFLVKHIKSEEIAQRVNKDLEKYKEYHWIRYPIIDCVSLVKKYLAEYQHIDSGKIIIQSSTTYKSDEERRKVLSSYGYY